MQTSTWADFITAVAVTVGDGVRGDIVAERRTLPDDFEDAADGPTYIARGG